MACRRRVRTLAWNAASIIHCVDSDVQPDNHAIYKTKVKFFGLKYEQQKLMMHEYSLKYNLKYIV